MRLSRPLHIRWRMRPTMYDPRACMFVAKEMAVMSYFTRLRFLDRNCYRDSGMSPRAECRQFQCAALVKLEAVLCGLSSSVDRFSVYRGDTPQPPQTCQYSKPHIYSLSEARPCYWCRQHWTALIRSSETFRSAGFCDHRLKARQASTASPTLHKVVSTISSIQSHCLSTYFASFILTTSLITSLSKSGNMPDSVSTTV